MRKIERLDFTINDVPGKLLGLGQAIVLVAKKLNEVIDAVNEIKKEKS